MLKFRYAQLTDVDLFFTWANDELVRANSYEQLPIDYKTHSNWFNNKIKSPNVKFYIFNNELLENVGQVRIEYDEEAVIGISIDSKYRGKGYGTEMLKMATNDFRKKFPHLDIYAYIKESNVASYKTFLNAGFIDYEMVEVQKCQSHKLILKHV